MNLKLRFIYMLLSWLYLSLQAGNCYAQKSADFSKDFEKAQALTTSDVYEAKAVYLKMLQKTGISGHEKVLVYERLSVIESRLGNLKQALQYALIGLRQAEIIGNKKDIADAHFQIGKVYKNLNLFLKSAEYFQKSAELYYALGDKKKYINARNFVGHVYTDFGASTKDFSYLIKSDKIYSENLNFSQKRGDKQNVLIAYNNLANLNLMRYTVDSNEVWLKQCKRFARRIITDQKNVTDSVNYSVALANLGEAFILELEMDSGIAIIHRSYAYNPDKQNQSFYYYSAKKLANGFLAVKNTKAADTIIENYKNRFIANQDLAEYRDYYNLKAQLESLRGNYKEAYELRLKYSAYMEQVRESESARELVRLQFLYDLEKKNREIDILNKNKKLQSENAENETWIRNLLIVGVVLLIALLIFIYLRYRENLSNNLLILSKNEELERLSIVARSTSNAITITNSEGLIQWINDGYKNLYGYDSIDELFKLQGNTIFDQCGLTRAEITQYVEDVKESKSSVVFQAFKELKTGEQKFIQTNLTPVFSANGALERLVFVETDITELLEAREIALKEKRKAENALKTQELFLANVSHEIRTPMNGIIGLTRQLQEELVSDSHKEITQSIHLSAENLLHVVNDLLDVSKIRAGKMSIEQTSFSLRKLLDNFKKSIQYRATEKGLDFYTHMDSNLKEHVFGDPIRLNQILLNLVGNAIKFTVEGRITVSMHLIDATSTIQNIRFEISDTGIGIPPAKKDLVFDHFVQLEDHRTRTISGTGLGLGISKTLVEAMGGKLNLFSEEGVGTTIKFDIPFEIDEHMDKPEDKTHEIVLHKDLSGLRVLLVEDNSINQKVIVHDLRKWKCAIEVVSDAFEAIEMLKNKKFDVILMDYYMPRMDGIETTQYIRTKFPEPTRSVPIIAITASAMRGDNDKFIQAGMNDYISKPFNPEKLYHLLVKWGYQLDHDLATYPTDQTVHESSVFDFSLMQERAEGDDNYLKEMFKAFIEMIPQYQLEFNRYYRESNQEELRKSAHQLLSPCRLFGMHRTAEILVTIENEPLSADELEKAVEEVNSLLTNGCEELRIRLTTMDENNP